LFVGADFERKGGPLLLDLFRARLRQSCELHLVTRASITEEPGVRTYTGFDPNAPGLRALYAECDALVLPTRADCFSLAALEAMAGGLPVISCPVGAIPEIVSQDETGLLVPPDDGPALLAAIQSLVNDPRRSLALGLAGRRVVEARFDNAKQSRALFALLRRFGTDHATAG
jgi:glycosyltransferase involved in cell wall biosynthesis